MLKENQTFYCQFSSLSVVRAMTMTKSKTTKARHQKLQLFIPRLYKTPPSVCPSARDREEEGVLLPLNTLIALTTGGCQEIHQSKGNEMELNFQNAI